MSSSTSRFARSALLLLGSAVLAAVLAVASTPRFARAKVPPLDSLPWNAVAGIERPRTPLALLYVQSSCSHCSAAARAIDSLALAGHFRAVIVTSDSAAAADAYRAKLSLRSPIALDTAKAMLHALNIESVPTLIVFAPDGARHLVVGFRGDAPYRRLLRSLE
jgi:hypothetical protein